MVKLADPSEQAALRKQKSRPRNRRRLFQKPCLV